MDVTQYSGNRAEWDDYVLRSEAATIYHQIGWKDVIKKTFGHKPYYLMAKEDGKVQGLLPLFLMRSRLFGPCIVSIPFFDYGGVVAENREVAENLISKAIEIARENNVKFLELRQRGEIYDGGFITKTNKVSFTIPLTSDPEVIWRDTLRKNKRKKIKKASKQLAVRLGHSQECVLKCYKVFSRAMRDLGTPVYPIALFTNICEVFPNQTKILMATYKGKVVGAKIMFFFKDTVFWRFQYSLRKLCGLACNELLYWTAIKYACENGYEFCDLGRSTRGSGSCHFKRQFGAQERQLSYQYYVNGANKLPDISPSNQKYKLAVGIWKRLPLFLTEIIGPKIVRNIP